MVSNHSDSLQQNIAQLIHQQKGILTTRLLTKSFDQLGFDLVDLIDIILAVEKKYQITIPDEVPLNSVADFVSFIQATRASASISIQE
jgi:acyl carrier protein